MDFCQGAGDKFAIKNTFNYYALSFEKDNANI
jgi:hypothetical protein